jgi:hypothetical protein
VSRFESTPRRLLMIELFGECGIRPRSPQIGVNSTLLATPDHSRRHLARSGPMAREIVGRYSDFFISENLAMYLSFSKLGTRGTSPTLYLQYFSVVVYSYDSWRVAGSQSDLLNLWEICLNAPENQQPDLSAGEK